MKNVFADRMSLLGTETAFEVLAKAKRLEVQGKDVVHLEIGEPDFDTPRNIIDAACLALNRGYTHYTAAPGIPEVRETIAEYIRSHKNVDASADMSLSFPVESPSCFSLLWQL